MTIDKEILYELKKLNKLITLTNGEKLEEELNKFITTNERKRIWIFTNGTNNTSIIAKKVGISDRAVRMAHQAFEELGLVERNTKTPPMRVIDYVPESWLHLNSNKKENKI